MSKLYPEFFQRLDESPDVVFYAEPRLVSHLGEAASRAAEMLYDKLLPGGHILDLMASYCSHLPDKFSQVSGLGLNQVELSRNARLSDYTLHDLNRNPALPFEDRSFDGVVCTVSVQYLTRPVDVFAEVARTLKPGAPFVVTYSDHMFPTKAVLAWRTSNHAAHARLVEHYFEASGGFDRAVTEDRSPKEGEPLYATWARKRH